MKPDIEEKYDGVTTLKIGEAACRANVNKETVRYCEKRELIPKPDRRISGYRIFTHHHIDQIQFIKRARKLVFTLSEIKELLELRMDEDSSCEQVLIKAASKPKKGDCCAFCSYGNTPCNLLQKTGNCC